MGSRPQFIFRLNKQKYQSYFQNEKQFQCLVASGRIGYIYLSWSYLFLWGVDSILPFAWITYISCQVNVLRCVLYASLFLDEKASSPRYFQFNLCFKQILFLDEVVLFLEGYQEHQGLFLVRVFSLYIVDLISFYFQSIYARYIQ